jgi:prevent-host-death family protein
METVGLREANVHFTSYIKKVRAGAEIVLTDRGTPVAIIKPITSNECPLEMRLTQPVLCKGGLISDTVTDLRRERW